MHSAKLLTGFAVLTVLAPLAAHGQVFLNLSSANVIGGSPVFFDEDYNIGAYAAGNIFSQQTGAVDMSSPAGNAWFPFEFSGSGLVNRFVTIDLGAPTSLAGIEIFNSNQADRGTFHFSLSAGNAIETGTPDQGHPVGSVVSSPVTLLSSTALTYSVANPVGGQSFAIPDTTPYRYLQLTLIDGQSQVTLSGVGLAEVRIIGAAVPEPEEYAAITGAALVGFMIWRRRGAR